VIADLNKLLAFEEPFTEEFCRNVTYLSECGGELVSGDSVSLRNLVSWPWI